jgi:hypothetical protein
VRISSLHLVRWRSIPTTFTETRLLSRTRLPQQLSVLRLHHPHNQTSSFSYPTKLGRYAFYYVVINRAVQHAFGYIVMKIWQLIFTTGLPDVNPPWELTIRIATIIRINSVSTLSLLESSPVRKDFCRSWCLLLSSLVIVLKIWQRATATGSCQ